ncbi:hypothetical protein HanIR_Chr05g0242981 [Helianthus annuus]|nr:hypothetical protein HanIR_Chr05g0242981 [Helianthus annuus]
MPHVIFLNNHFVYVDTLLGQRIPHGRQTLFLYFPSHIRLFLYCLHTLSLSHKNPNSPFLSIISPFSSQTLIFSADQWLFS